MVKETTADMPRLRNARSGVIVNVSEDMAATLNSEWEPVTKPAPRKPAPRRRQPRKPDSEK